METDGSSLGWVCCWSIRAARTSGTYRAGLSKLRNPRTPPAAGKWLKNSDSTGLLAGSWRQWTGFRHGQSALRAS
jgi:hypothetical protein